MLSLPLVVFSHLRWESVRQRPQHLLSRFAGHSRVLFIEEPIYDPSPNPRWEIDRPEPNLMVCRPHTPATQPGYSPEQLPHMALLLRQLHHDFLPGEFIAWLYTPMALPFARPLRPDLLIYDCMDELAAFRFAPPALIQWENELMQEADLVFTGGPSLYAARQHKHAHVHCFPSSVDSAHFAQAREPLAEPDDQKSLRHPRLGFFGVLDERLDLDLISATATARPDWELVLVGPVVKIDPNALPQAANIHYLGARQYDVLPSYLAGWDVCLLPFAMNDATRFISPTKTLEYMAAAKPIVSTPLTDVVALYNDAVEIAGDHAEFIAACDRALNDSQLALERRRAGEEILSRTSWDSTVLAMGTLISHALQRKRRGTQGGDRHAYEAMSSVSL